MYSMTSPTGTPVKAQDLKVGARVLIGVDTKQVKSVTTKDGFTYITLRMNGGRTDYRTFPATRTFYTY